MVMKGERTLFLADFMALGKLAISAALWDQTIMSMFRPLKIRNFALPM